MAIGDPYATETELIARLGSDDFLTTNPDLLTAASRAVESFTARQFNKDTVATPRRARPVDWRRMPVDDFHTATGLVVTVAGTAWDLANVDPQPWDGVVDGQSGWPFYDLIAVGRSWPCDAVITVTAQWGWPSVPLPVRDATLDVAVAMLNRSGSSYPVRTESVGPFTFAYDIPSVTGSYDEVPPELARICRYRRRKAFGVA